MSHSSIHSSIHSYSLVAVVAVVAVVTVVVVVVVAVAVDRHPERPLKRSTCCTRRKLGNPVKPSKT